MSGPFLGSVTPAGKLHLDTGRGARCHEGLELPHGRYPIFGNPWSPLSGERGQALGQIARYGIEPDALCAKCFPAFLVEDFREVLALYGKAHP